MATKGIINHSIAVAKKDNGVPMQKSKGLYLLWSTEEVFSQTTHHQSLWPLDLYIEKENLVNNDAILIKKVENRAE